MKKASVIVPIFNASKTLKRCINSILSQTYQNIELILVNDGSSDDSLKICNDFAKIDKRIKVINKKNSGVSSARNDGMINSTGDYIIFVDSDDYIDENLLTEVLQYNNFDLVIFGYSLIVNNREKKIMPKQMSYNTLNDFSEDFSNLYFQNIINSPCNKLYKKNLITNFFPKDIDMGEDLIFNLNYLTNCNSIKCLDLSLYNYVISKTDSLSQKYNINAIDNSILLQKSVLNFCNKKFNKYSITEINNKYLEDCFSNIQKLIFSRKVGKQECIKAIEYMSNLDITLMALASYNLQNIQYNLFSKLLKKKLYNIIYYYFILKWKVKRLL